MKNLPKLSGIYQILCTSSGKIYIGSAVNIYVRCTHHRKMLRAGKHVNVHLQNAWNLYGEETFVFSVVELVDMDNLVITEQRWLDETQCYKREYGYNVRSIAESNAGIIRTDEVRKKLSIARKGKKFGPLSDEHRQKLSEIHKGKTYWQHNEESKRKISEAGKGRVFSSESIEKIRQSAKKRGVAHTTRQAQVAAVSKRWLVIDPDGNEISITNLEKFCREHGLTTNCMRAVSKGITTHHKGWKCRSLED